MPATTRANWVVQLELQNPDTEVWENVGRWAVLEGAGATAEDASYHDWDGQIRLGGVKTREDATLRRAFGRHANEVYSTLDRWVGRARARLARTATNDAGVTFGETLRYTGVLGGAKLSDVEKGSSEAAEIELMIQLDAELA